MEEVGSHQYHISWKSAFYHLVDRVLNPGARFGRELEMEARPSYPEPTHFPKSPEETTLRKLELQAQNHYSHVSSG